MIKLLTTARHFKQTGPANLPCSTRMSAQNWKSPWAVSPLCPAFRLATAGRPVPSAVTEARTERSTTIETVFIDGAGQPLRKGRDRQFRVSPGSHRVEFRFGPTQVAADDPSRPGIPTGWPARDWRRAVCSACSKRGVGGVRPSLPAGRRASELISRLHEFHPELRLPPEPLFPFFAEAANLDALTPPRLHVYIATPLPTEMRTGTLMNERLRVHGLPLHRCTRVNVWQPPHRFMDEPIRGPYRQSIHEHTFEARHGGTPARNHMRHAVPLDWPVHRRPGRPSIERSFRFRSEALRGRSPATQPTPV
jgi:ligand-binding SRPBCC domain-containing protein